MKSKIDFLTFTLTYLENRIRFVDNKVTQILALQGGLFAVYSLVNNEVFLSTQSEDIKLLARGAIGLYFLFLIVFGLLCIQVIRPSSSVFTSKVNLKRIDVSPYVLWYKGDLIDNPNKFESAIQQLDTATILKNYEAAIFACHQLLAIKYKRYANLITLMKLLFVYCAASPLIIYNVILILHCGLFS